MSGASLAVEELEKQLQEICTLLAMIHSITINVDL
jgi:hypothetical protein